MRILTLCLLLHAVTDTAVRVPAMMRLKDGTVYELRQPPHLKDGRFVFTTSDGKTFSLAEREVEEIQLVTPPSAARRAPNPHDSRDLGAIARRERGKKGLHTMIAPAPTPRPSRRAASSPG